jgi:hypothetical protein
MSSVKMAIRTEASIRANAVDAIANLNCESNLARVQRTRRAIRDVAIGLREQRARQRRNLGCALATVLCILILLAPAIWNSVEDVMGGEHFTDFPLQSALFLLLLFPSMIAALIAMWRGDRSLNYDERGS